MCCASSPTTSGKRYREARRNGDQDVLDEQRRINVENRGTDRKMMNQLRQWWIDRILATPRPAEERLTLLWHGPLRQQLPAASATRT